MRRETTAGIALLACALALGVAADALFRGQPVGVNVVVWVSAFTVALVALLRLTRAPLHQGRRLMVAPLLLFAAFFAWHDSPLLTAVNLLALAAAVTLGALRRVGPRLHLRGLLEYGGGALAAGVAAFAGLIPVVRDVDWDDVGGGIRSNRMAAVARGVVIGMPLMLLFGGLFVAADAVFKSLVVAAVPNVRHPVAHVAFVAATAWIAGGVLRDLVAARDDQRQLSPAAIAARGRGISLGIVEIGVVLAALDVLFLAFVLVQVRYLFGGSGLVEARTHLSYAEYARHGFFELVGVAALVLPVVLLADSVLDRRRRRDEVVFRALAAVLVLLLFVVMASALERLRLYEREYGLTELRVYATGIVLWLAVVFIWFCATVLRGRRRLFAVGAIASGFAASAVINVVDPDALIARTNLDRPRVDVQYVARLSDDAVPTIVARLPALEPRLRRRLAIELLLRDVRSGSWQSWNLSRARAADVLEAHRAELQRYASAAGNDAVAPRRRP